MPGWLTLGNQLTDVRLRDPDIIARFNSIRMLCVKRDEIYSQYRIAQKRYDDANGDFKEIAGPGARLVVEKYKT